MKEQIAIITPCYNEGSTVVEFLKQLEETLVSLPYSFTVVVVNDASTDHTLDNLLGFNFSARNVTLSIITLKFNLGHQGAIYQGLLYSQKKIEADQFIVMDSDGEDSPSAIPAIIDKRSTDVVHVVRGKRNEGMLFRVAYYFYRFLFKAITNKNMNFGNYCMINRKTLDLVVHTSFIHFAAYLSKVKASHAYVTYDRQRRIGGSLKNEHR